MSKSYRKYPIVVQEKIDKKQENKRVRHTMIDTALNGGQYKRISSEANWKYMWTLEDAIESYSNSVNGTGLEEWIQYWYRCTTRK